MSQVQDKCENTYFSVIFTKIDRTRKVPMFQLIQQWVWCSGWPLFLTNGPQKQYFEVVFSHRPSFDAVLLENISVQIRSWYLSDCPLIFELLNICRLTLSNSLIGHKNNVAKYVLKNWGRSSCFYKFSSNVSLGGFLPGYSLVLAGMPNSKKKCIGRIRGIRAFSKHSLLCWPWPHHPISQFQCYGRILSERLTCPVDWTRSPPPTHAIWPLCGSCHKHARHYA